MNLSLSGLDWILGGGALAVNILLGLWFALRARQSGSSDEFFLAGRRLTWPVVGASLLATNIGAEHMVGLCGDAYRYGLCAGTVELTTAFCLGIAAAILIPYYLKNQVFTIPEFLELRYRKEARFFFSAMMLLICIVTKMAFCLYAGALVLQGLLGWDIMPTIAALAVMTAIITMIGGFAVVAYTDAIHAPILILGSALVLLIGLSEVGGWEALCAAVAHTPVPDAMHIYKPYDDPVYPFWGIILASIYGGTFYWGIDQVNVQRLLGAKNLNHARWGAMFAVLLKLTPVFIFALPGVIALVLFPGREYRTTFVTILNDLLPSGIRGYVLSALVGAIISALIAVMNSVSTMAVRDFMLHFRPHMTERTQIRLGRLAIVLSAALGTAAAYVVYKQPEGIYKYLQTISIYLLMPITPAIVFGIVSKRVTFAGAAASVLVGLVLTGMFVADAMMAPEAAKRCFPWLHHPLTFNYTYRGAWGTLIVTAVLFLVSAFSKHTDPDKLAKTTIDWNKRPEPFRGLSDWRLHLAVLLAMTATAYWWLW
ncbi:MAG: sodium/solute symporter [Planctomycetes bacterium]|nr:sodium/solute symporter [Planctomycetota bacterium]MBU4400435.1 sodium/solute symporter [Planctomycetota bacterium]MCG2684039.1 sodium/solute symporter [Planctomycetales bacterium]